MFNNFAEYVRVLTDAISAVHPMPLYINSPWWPSYVIPVFLDRCPNLALVGIDGVFAPNEPNMLSASQLGRNLPFAAENPTENPKTRLNLDVLPYYSLIGQQGIGNLLWECGRPHTVVEDPQARQRYGAALYPIRWAQSPVARARGTTNFLGWYVIRDIATDLTTDIFGNFLPAKTDGRIAQKTRLFVRDGKQSRVVDGDHFAASLGDLKLEISDSAAGIVVRTAPTEMVLAVPKGRVAVQAPGPLQVTAGRFERDQWLPEREFKPTTQGKAHIFQLNEPKVLRVKYVGAQ